MKMKIDPDISSSGNPNITKDNSGGIPKKFCPECQKIWYGWADSKICPDCGGILTGLKAGPILISVRV